MRFGKKMRADIYSLCVVELRCCFYVTIDGNVEEAPQFLCPEFDFDNDFPAAPDGTKASEDFFAPMPSKCAVGNLSLIHI